MKISLLLNFIISFPINIRQQSVILPIRSFCQSACHHHRHRPLSQVPVLLSTNAVNGSSQFVSPCPSGHDRVLHMSPSAESQSLCCWRIFFLFLFIFAWRYNIFHFFDLYLVPVLDAGHTFQRSSRLLRLYLFDLRPINHADKSDLIGFHLLLLLSRGGLNICIIDQRATISSRFEDVREAAASFKEHDLNTKSGVKRRSCHAEHHLPEAADHM